MPNKLQQAIIYTVAGTAILFLALGYLTDMPSSMRILVALMALNVIAWAIYGLLKIYFWCSDRRFRNYWKTRTEESRNADK